MGGSAIWVSIAVLHIRKSAFERKLEELAERKRKRNASLRTLTFSLTKRHRAPRDEHEEAVASGVVRGRAIEEPEPHEEYHPSFVARSRTQSFGGMDGNAEETGKPNGNSGEQSATHIHFGNLQRPPQRATSVSQEIYHLRRRPLLDFSGVAAQRTATSHPRLSQPVTRTTDETDADEQSKPRSDSLARMNKYFDSIGGFVGRNSRFHSLTESERRRLGGLEYDALTVLSYLVPIYFVLFQLFGAIGIGAWLQINQPSVEYENGELLSLLRFSLLTPIRLGSFLDRYLLCGQRIQQLWHGAA